MTWYEVFIGPKDANRNIRAAFISATFGSIGFGMLFGNILSIFILTLANESTIMLGLVTMVGGLASTIFIFPSGYISDRWRRDVFIWVGGVFNIFSVITLAFSTTIEMVILAHVLFGAGWGISGTASEALIADSLPSGKRSKIYAQLFFLRFGFTAVGPAVNIVLFLFIGDEWGLETLRIVIFAAAIVTFAGSFSTFFMSDKHSLGEESESLASRTIEESKERSSFTIPIVVVCCSLIIGFGAGMTVAFFPVFFKEEYSLKPILVNGIYLFMHLATGSSGIIGQRFSKRLGLIETMFLLQMAAIYALALIIQYPPLILLIPLFIARNALMNATMPLNRTIVMDRIAKRHRGKWNALEQLSWGFFWNISAAFGGWLIENYGFKVCFTITATLYTLATLPLLVLFGRVEAEGTRKSPVPSVELETQPVIASTETTDRSLIE